MSAEVAEVKVEKAEPLFSKKNKKLFTNPLDIDNPVTVQFLHRWLALGVAAYAIGAAIWLYRAGAGWRAVALGSGMLLQFLLGVLTLLNSVPIPLGVAHQSGAVLLLLATIAAGHWSRGGARRSPIETDRATSTSAERVPSAG